MAPPIDKLLNTLLFATPFLHLLLAPYTKVEESFNLQATHDLLVYGTPTPARLRATYDHFIFPGAVPRTFVGAVILAGSSQPLVTLFGFASAQLIVRGVLGALNATALLVFRRAVDRAFGRATGRWWLALMVCQFHVMFYLSRTLPNMFSFGFTTLASAFLLPKTTPSAAQVRQKQALLLLVFSAAVFRSETAIILATTSLYMLLTRRATLKALVSLLAGLSIAAIALSVPIDSYFWQKLPLWPELAGFYYNAVQGSSSNWGVSPWHYYFTSALPRLLLNPLSAPLIVFALVQPATSGPARDLVLPNLLFVAIYSAQPHKEARFIFYVVPALTAAAALGANYIFSHRTKTFFYGLVSLLLPVSILASFAASTGMLLLSSLNYPGGDALTHVYAIANASPTTQPVSVHADVLTCMTGLTLFGQNPSGAPVALAPAGTKVVFDKTEDAAELAKPQFWKRFDYVLAEDPLKVLGGQWKTVAVVQGYAGIEVLKPGMQVDEDPIADVNPEAATRKPQLVGRGLVVQKTRDLVRRVSRGWWVGPRMEPRIHIMKQVKAAGEPSKASS